MQIFGHTIRAYCNNVHIIAIDDLNKDRDHKQLQINLPTFFTVNAIVFYICFTDAKIPNATLCATELSPIQFGCK